MLQSHSMPKMDWVLHSKGLLWLYLDFFPLFQKVGSMHDYWLSKALELPQNLKNTPDDDHNEFFFAKIFIPEIKMYTHACHISETATQIHLGHPVLHQMPILTCAASRARSSSIVFCVRSALKMMKNSVITTVYDRSG